MATGSQRDGYVVDLTKLLAINVSALDAPGCSAVLETVQRARGLLAGVESQVSLRLDMLAADNAGPPPAEGHNRSQRVSAAEARRRERRARLLSKTPKMADALSSGDVTEDHVDALANACAKASDEVRDAVLKRQAQLTKQASRLSPEKFRKHCDDIVQKTERDEGLDRAEQQRKNTSLRSWIDNATGMRRLAGALDPELGSRIWTAIQAELAAGIYEDDTQRTVDRDRLAALALGRLVAGGHVAARPNRADLTVIVDHDTLLHGLHEGGTCELSDGSLLPPATIRRLACEASIIPAVLGGDGMPLDVGRASRLATPAQRTALRLLHDTCSFPGCDVDFDRCEIHHLLDWGSMGPTDLQNLTPACSRHHHLLHEGGWKARITAEHVLEVWAPGSKAPADAVGQTRVVVPGDTSGADGRRSPASAGSPGSVRDSAGSARSQTRTSATGDAPPSRSRTGPPDDGSPPGRPPDQSPAAQSPPSGRRSRQQPEPATLFEHAS